jgi:uncharacterized protein (DUF433 family)
MNVSEARCLYIIVSEECEMKFKRITIDPFQMDGLPCIRGLRIPVAKIVGALAEGMTEVEVLAAYPDLEMEDIREALKFAAETLQERQIPMIAIE